MGRKNYPWDSRVDKQMTNLVSGLITGIIFAPFAAVDLLSKTSTTSTHYSSNLQINNISDRRKHKELVRHLSKKTDRDIKLEYINNIESSGIIKKQLDSLSFKIGLYKAKLRLFGFISPYREQWLSVLKETIKKKLEVEDVYNPPIINLDKYTSSYPYPKKTNITGHVLLQVNRKFRTGDYLEEETICRRVDKKQSFFNVSKAPNAKFTFDSIEFFFYDEMMLIMTANDFVIVDNSAYKLDYRIIDFDGVGVHLPGSSTHWYNVGLLEIKTFSQTVNLLFFKKNEGDFFYQLIKKYREGTN